jgi:hypothetical protein
MTTVATLRIRFTSFWVAGTGASHGRHVDVVTHRDRLRLPAMPMTQVKGQLRETAERLAAGGHAGWTGARVVDLFGTRSGAQLNPQGQPAGGGPATVARRSRTVAQTDPLGHNDTQSGTLAFQGEARLPEDVRAHLSNDETLARLFRRIAATRIDENGVAQDKTLRAIEAVVPLTLEGTVTWIGAPPPAADWVVRLDQLCAATLAFGKLKADGYGRAIAACVP